ncbi:MAG TPA: DUF1788 domain-containing protein [Flavisolibacter sp.]|jgi:hypothetical protein|nr:DUF1788 domain-containing protein [Flavisolibacter sp.]
MITENLHNKFDHIHKVISTEKFLKIEALGGEIPFWISTYHPKQEVEINQEITHIQKKLETEGKNILLIDLFELSMSIADEAMGLEALFQIEQKKTKERFKKALQSTMNIHERLIPSIKKQVSEQRPQVLMIKGVGRVYPFIRSHNVLNNLQSAVTVIPTLMFFPGRYTGQSLELFGMMKDDNYYRAFNIDNHKI